MHDVMMFKWPAVPKNVERDLTLHARAWMRRDPTIKSVVVDLEPIAGRLEDRVTRLANCAILKAVR